MIWRVRSIRNAAGLPPDGEAALRPIPALGGGKIAGVGHGSAGHGSSGTTSPGSRATGFRQDQSSNGAVKGTSGPETVRESADETGHRTQPSGTDGVPEDMATLVLDNSALG